MNRLISFITAGLLSLDVLLVLSTPLRAQENDSCTATITNAQNLIKKGRDIVVSVSTKDIDKQYPDHPENRAYSYQFVIDINAYGAVETSPNFMKIIASRIVNSCQDVSLVIFAKSVSDVFVYVGLMPDGEMKFFDCSDNSTNEIQPWGKRSC